MRAERIEKEVMSKSFEGENRALDERIVARQVIVVPDELPLQRWQMHSEPERGDDETAQPGTLKKINRPNESGRGLVVDLVGRGHEPGGFETLSAFGR